MSLCRAAAAPIVGVMGLWWVLRDLLLLRGRELLGGMRCIHWRKSLLLLLGLGLRSIRRGSAIGRRLRVLRWGRGHRGLMRLLLMLVVAGGLLLLLMLPLLGGAVVWVRWRLVLSCRGVSRRLRVNVSRRMGCHCAVLWVFRKSGARGGRLVMMLRLRQRGRRYSS